ncbi:MarR family winged helix-turn-helix transcriptional regulator [Desulfovibrio subterraneus]|uniref:MarR family transcriptional regulator n=1 Tax=Desulfovibrio subterraneus TaxID=2718620 RepID=A0A7J0BHY8_9BACT|nr:MarR family transcriptional regulator [Desulfovibrio subterraneus]
MNNSEIPDADVTHALNHALNHAIVEFYEKLSSWEHDVVREKGLTLPQVHTLEILGIHRAMQMKELASRMGITTGTLTVLVDRLESKRCVRRRPHDSDRRSIIVELTDEGMTLFEEHDRLHMQLTESLTAGLDAESRTTLLRCLQTMNRTF